MKKLTKIKMKNANEIHKEFVRLGRNRRRLTNKLLMLLPEIFESGIYKEKGGTSIVEFLAYFCYNFRIEIKIKR